jgi:hypothetical protein
MTKTVMMSSEFLAPHNIAEELKSPESDPAEETLIQVAQEADRAGAL